MNFNLTMLLREFPEEMIAEQHLTDPYRFRLAYCAFPAGAELREEVLYIAEAADLPQYPEAGVPVSVLCIGEPPAGYRRPEIDLAILKAGISVMECFNRVQRILSRWNRWEQEMIPLLLTDGPYEAVGEQVWRLLGNPVQLYNRRDQLLFNCYDPKDAASAAYCERYLDPDYVSEEMQVVNLDPNLRMYYETRDLCHVPSELAREQVVFFNLFAEDRYLGKVFMVDTVHHFREGDYALLRYAADLLLRYRLQSETANPYPDSLLVGLAELCRREHPEADLLPRILTHTGWKAEDSYIIYYVQALNPNISVHVLETSLIFIRTDPLAYCILAEEEAHAITILFNLTRVGDDRNWIRNELNSFCKSHEYVGGCSAPFCGLISAHIHYDQARSVTEMHLAERNYTIFSFEKNILSGIRQLCLREHPAEFYQTEGLQRLIAYDRIHDSDLVNTLRVYLAEESNIARTSERLHIHRSTFTYRMEHIEKVSGIRLDSETARLYLRVALALL